MKKFLTLIFIFIQVSLIAQVGIGTDDPKGALDITTSNNMALIIPRVTSVETVTDGNANPPLNGSTVYDISRSATCFYQNDHWTCILNNSDGTVDVYPIEEDAYIKASNTGTNDQFGWSVSLSDDGNTLAVGAPSEASNATGINGDQTDNTAFLSGAIFIFIRSGNTWAQQAYIKASNTTFLDTFGRIVTLSADGNTLATGAHGEDSNATGINGDQTNSSASASGAAYVFTRSGTTWSQQAYIKASNTQSSDNFSDGAVSLSSDGNTLAIGASLEDSNATGINGDQTNNSAARSGAVYIFTRSGTTWTQQAYIKASNTQSDDRFGVSVTLSLDGNTLAIGATQESSNATGINGNQTNNSESESGAVYVYTRSGTTWTQQAYIKASNTGSDDHFGRFVSISDDGNTLAVGSIRERSNGTSQADNSVSSSGAVYIFTRSGTTWSQQAYIKASNPGVSDLFGLFLNISNDGNTLAVGAFGEDSIATGINGNQADNSAIRAGAVYIFTRSGSTWSQQSYVKAPNTNANDSFGISVALSGDGSKLATGAYQEASNATGINGDQTNNTQGGSGAVYIIPNF